MSIEFFPKAVKYLETATQLDRQDKIEEAYTYYIRGMEYLLTGLKYSTNEKLNQTIRNKIKEYMQRAETIKKLIEVNATNMFLRISIKMTLYCIFSPHRQKPSKTNLVKVKEQHT